MVHSEFGGKKGGCAEIARRGLNDCCPVSFCASVPDSAHLFRPAHFISFCETSVLNTLQNVLWHEASGRKGSNRDRQNINMTYMFTFNWTPSLILASFIQRVKKLFSKKIEAAGRRGSN